MSANGGVGIQASVATLKRPGWDTLAVEVDAIEASELALRKIWLK